MTEVCFKHPTRYFVLAGAVLCFIGIFWIVDPHITSLDPERAVVQNAQHELRDKNYREALDLLIDGAYKFPRNADIRYYMGVSYAGLNQLQTAVGQYQLALQLNPNHVLANYVLGQNYVQTQQWDAAQKILGNLQRLCASGIGCTERDAVSAAFTSAYAKQQYKVE